MRKLPLFVLLAAIMPCASAQRPMPPAHFPSGGPAAHPRPLLYPLVFFSDYFDTDATFRSGHPPAPQRAVIVLQAPATTSAPEPAPAPAQPLLIELKGDRYIRVTSEEPAGAEMMDRQPVPPLKRVRASRIAIPIQDRALAVLVFHDGHREEVAAYTIADGILYTEGNYYTDGSWNRKIKLSSLNLSETIEASRSRGVHFRLPAASNEVVTRP